MEDYHDTGEDEDYWVPSVIDCPSCDDDMDERRPGVFICRGCTYELDVN